MFSKDLFAQRVREVRKLHNETQKQLGDAIGTKANNKTTTSEKIAKLCQHYHVSADYLLGLSDDPRGGVERWGEE